MRLITALSALPAVVVAAIAAPSPSGLNITEGVDVLTPQMNNTEGMDFYVKPPPQNISLPDVPNALVKAQLKRYQPRLLPAILRHLLHNISADNFLQWRKQRVPEWVDWNSIGDSNMPSNPYRFPFKAACNRHDFGVQNYGPNLLPRTKKRLDAQFKKDLKKSCGEIQKGTHEVCLKLGKVYLGAVQFNSGAFPLSAQSLLARAKKFYELVADYARAVQEAQSAGHLPPPWADGPLPHNSGGDPW